MAAAAAAAAAAALAAAPGRSSSGGGRSVSRLLPLPADVTRYGLLRTPDSAATWRLSLKLFLPGNQK